MCRKGLSTSGRKTGHRRSCIKSQEIFERNKGNYIFCGENDSNSPLNAAQDDRTQERLRQAAEIKQDDDVLATFQLGDLFTQEMHYHLQCYVLFTRQPTTSEE
ncbi:hypothetical protein ElyMa_006861500 [Elysia marginata]|uniref:Uncharacterized protein n=1 Tax=Elysia marginata TaxID=1093978 RepID=A0AAV4J9K3_9GAST|nr:hypothetical protein ElyMa_006861500 [Elysia marginata]